MGKYNSHIVTKYEIGHMTVTSHTNVMVMVTTCDEVDT